jgi:hypothetical protein
MMITLLNTFYTPIFFLYVDPGSGNMLIQLLVAAALGVAFYFRAGWNYLKSIFRKNKDDKA